MNRSRKNVPATAGTRRGSLSLLTAALSSLAFGAYAAEGARSAEMMLQAMTPAEFAEIAAEANAKGAARNATAAERAELAIPSGRRASATEGGDLKSATKRREMRSGNAVGMVMGTELMSHRTVSRGVNGEHLQSCSTEPHSHDAKTALQIAQAKKQSSAATPTVKGARDE